MTAPVHDELTVKCPHCGNPAGMRCGSISGWSRRTHAARVKLAAHTAPALDAHFKPRGQCQICGTPGLDARHRVIDAIAGSLEAGESIERTAGEYEVTVKAVKAVRDWAQKYPGAWRCKAQRGG